VLQLALGWRPKLRNANNASIRITYSTTDRQPDIGIGAQCVACRTQFIGQRASLLDKAAILREAAQWPSRPDIESEKFVSPVPRSTGPSVCQELECEQSIRSASGCGVDAGRSRRLVRRVRAWGTSRLARSVAFPLRHDASEVEHKESQSSSNPSMPEFFRTLAIISRTSAPAVAGSST